MRDLTRQERQEIRALVYQCANYDRPCKLCLLLDIEDRPADCPMLAVTTTGKVCGYFKAAVLPLNPILEAAITHREPTLTKVCPICKTEFAPKTNRQQYCSEKCQKKGNANRSRERMRNMRQNSGVDVTI